MGNESWLTPDIGNNEIFPDNYNAFRKDRITNSRGSEVFQAVKKDIIIMQRADFKKKVREVGNVKRNASRHKEM